MVQMPKRLKRKQKNDVDRMYLLAGIYVLPFTRFNVLRYFPPNVLFRFADACNHRCVSIVNDAICRYRLMKAMLLLLLLQHIIWIECKIENGRRQKERKKPASGETYAHTTKILLDILKRWWFVCSQSRNLFGFCHLKPHEKKNMPKFWIKKVSYGNIDRNKIKIFPLLNWNWGEKNDCHCELLLMKDSKIDC